MNKPSKSTQQPNTAHFVLQGKGGMGKSYVASLIAQHFKGVGRNLACVDTDPVNTTLARYEELAAVRLPLLTQDNQIDQRKFDGLMESILSNEGKTFVVDNGATTFLPLASYMAENDAYEVLAASGVDLVTHCVVTGGQAMADTLSGLYSLAQISRPAGVVVWLNEYFGPLVHEGQQVTDLPVFTGNANKIRGMVRMQRRNADTFGADVADMARNHWTFEQAVKSSETTLMAKSRLKIIQRDINDQLTALKFA